MQHFIGIFLQLLFYGTPIVYQLEQLPPNLQVLMKLNPMTHIINGYRDIFYYHQMPNIKILTLLLGASFILVIIGYFIFKKLQKGFAEQL